MLFCFIFLWGLEVAGVVLKFVMFRVLWGWCVYCMFEIFAFRFALRVCERGCLDLWFGLNGFGCGRLWYWFGRLL